jgi:creatinine amidohydrolase
MARGHERKQLLSVHLLEEMSTPALDALDRSRTVIVLTLSPLETHGPHLPVGVDAFAARHFAETIARRLVHTRPLWSVVLAPTLHLGSFTFETVGTVSVRQRVVRDALVDYGEAFARAGFRYILVANGHGGPGHLAALDEAAATVTRRHGITMTSFTGHLAWEFMRGRSIGKIETALGRALTPDERRAFAEDAHGGWWETSLMLLLRPDLVDETYRTLPPARYAWPRRVVPNYAVKNGGPGYVGHPALADPRFARATTEVLMTEAMAIVDGLLDGTLVPSDRRSPFFQVPFFRTNFWPAAGATAAAVAGVGVGLFAWLRRRVPSG